MLFAWRDNCPPLTTDNAAEDICKLLRQAEIEQRYQMPLALIIVDTMIAAAAYAGTGDDNDSAATQKVMTTLANASPQTGAFVMGIDHFKKIVDTGTRGSSAKEGGADTVLAALADRDLAGTVKNSRLAVRKQRDGISGLEIPLTAQTVETGRDEDNYLITAVVIDWSTPQQPAAASTGPKWSKALQLLRRVMMTILADAGQDRQPFDDLTVRAVDVELSGRSSIGSTPPPGLNSRKPRRDGKHSAGHCATPKRPTSSPAAKSMACNWSGSSPKPDA